MVRQHHLLLDSLDAAASGRSFVLSGPASCLACTAATRNLQTSVAFGRFADGRLNGSCDGTSAVAAIRASRLLTTQRLFRGSRVELSTFSTERF